MAGAIGWALAWWGLVLYWVAGGLYVVQAARLVRAARVRAAGMSAPQAGRAPSLYAPDFLTELFRNPLDPGYADAAARRRRSGAPAPAWRRRSAGRSAW